MTVDIKADGLMIVDGCEYKFVRVAGSGRPKFDVYRRWTTNGGTRGHAEQIGRELDLESCKSLVRENAKKMRRRARRARRSKP